MLSTTTTFQRTIFLTGALMAAASVILGAMATHSLKTKITPEEMVTFETGVRYHQYHALAIFVCGFLAYFFKSSFRIPFAFIAFSLGIICFSGSLYVLAVSKHLNGGAGIELPHQFFLITPLGGSFFIVGWMFLAAAVLNRE